MSYPITKQERYANFSGINTKTSRFLGGQAEVIRLINYDFSRPGSLTKRPDTSQFLGASFGAHIKGVFEFVTDAGPSFMLVQSPSGLFSQGSFGVSQLAITNLIFGTNNVQGQTGYADFNNFDSSTWIANQWDTSLSNTNFYRYRGKELLYAQFPYPNMPFSPFNGLSYTAGASPVYFATLIGGVAAGWRWKTAFVGDKERPGPVNSIPLSANFWTLGATSIHLNIGLARSAATGAGLPYGASYLLVFREQIGASAASSGNDAVSVTTAVFKIPIGSGIDWLVDSGATTASFLVTAGTSFIPYEENTYWPFWDLGSAGATNQIVSSYYSAKDTGRPTLIATYNNMIFYAGFFKYPSHVFWSELGAPEWVDNENFNELRSADGERVTCLIPYDGSLVATKLSSLHVINGDDPDTVSFSEKSAVYGFMNNRSACVFQDTLWGIDGQGRGIVQFNGANLDIVSDKVQDIFLRINLTAALNVAWMLHVKSRNEVWCGIPVDGSDAVNTIIVYDYFSKGWTTFEGLEPTAVTIARGTLSLPQPVMGFSNGGIRYLNPGFSGLESITTVVRAPYISNFGWSTTETYRRLFVDTDPILGATYAFAMNLYVSQGSTPSYQATFLVTSPQSRAEFGLPGKGLSVELIESSDQPQRLNGYTVGSRFQRNV